MKMHTRIYGLVLALAISLSPVAVYAGGSVPEASSQSHEDNSVSPADLIKKSKLKCKKHHVKVAVCKYAKWVVVCS